jgi:molybdate transport system ATP-binding protein
MIKISIQKKLKMADGMTSLAIDTEITPGEFIAIFGKSGAGKTTLLRIISGLMQPEKGIIEVNGEVWLNTERKINLPVQKRKIGFVFQDFALFPNMSVRRNIRYALKGNKDKGFTNRLLEMVEMTALADRKPGTLSGGQQQRVAMIRALATKPGLLLLDEPLSALDMEMRSHLRDELQALHKEFNLTTLLVTHDITDIYRLADHVISIDKGKIVRSGKPDDLFSEAYMSSKVRLQGEVLQIRKSGVVFIVEILSGNAIIKVIAGKEEVAHLRTGSQVMVFSKAFNPVIRAM